MKNAIRLILFAGLLVFVAGGVTSFAAVHISITIAPPVLPVYAQPVCPGPGYLWVPGYWAYGSDGYYWVPGTWVLPPFVGALWTPGYWGWASGAYLWHAGYWGTQVGFYGGIDYGFGYTGVGYQGGYWNHGAFYYNRSVNHLNDRLMHHVYDRNVEGHEHNRVSFNGGHGGINVRPTAAQAAVDRRHHVGATASQRQMREAASRNRQQFASVNHGNPAAAAAPKPETFVRQTGHGAAQANRPATQHAPAQHAAVPRSAATEHRAPNRTQANRSANPVNRTPANRAQNHVATRQPEQHRVVQQPQQHAAPPAVAHQPARAPQNAHVQRSLPQHSARVNPAPRQQARPQQHAAPQQHGFQAQHNAARAPQEHAAPAHHAAPQHSAQSHENQHGRRGPGGGI